MRLLKGEKPVHGYKGDHEPMELYKGVDKVVGYKEEEQSGSLITFENTYNDSVKSMPIEGSTTQVKTTGKNLLDLSTAKGGSNSGITVTVNGDGSYTVNGTATSGSINVWFEGSYSETAETLFTLPAGSYTAYGINLYSGTTYICRCYEADNFVKTFTIAEDTNVTGVRCCMLTSGNTYTNKIIFPQLEEGTTATAYEPYTGGQPSPSPSYPQELVPLTVSGSVKNADGTKEQTFTTTLFEGQTADFGKGVETDDYSLVTLTSDMNWQLDKTSARTGFSLPDVTIPKTDEITSPTSKSNRFLFISNNATWANYDSVMAWQWINGSSPSTYKLWVKVDGITTLADFKTWLDEHETTVLYPVVTPTTTTIDTLPTYYPTTVISCDEEVTAKVLVEDA